MLGWIALFAAGYTALRVAFYGWYAIPLALGWAVLLAWGITTAGQVAGAILEWGGSRVRRQTGAASGNPAGRSGVPRAARWIVIGGVVVLIGLPLAAWVRDFAATQIATHRVSDLYQRAGEWIGAHGGPATSVAYLEVGEVGYYSQARVIDLLGLVTPGAAAQVPAHDFDWAVQRYTPEYYLANSRFEGTPQVEGLLMHLSHTAWFTAAYSPVMTMTEQRSGDPATYQMVIYRRQPGAGLPPPLHAVLAQWHTQQPLPLQAGRPPPPGPARRSPCPPPT